MMEDEYAGFEVTISYLLQVFDGSAGCAHTGCSCRSVSAAGRLLLTLLLLCGPFSSRFPLHIFFPSILVNIYFLNYSLLLLFYFFNELYSFWFGFWIRIEIDLQMNIDYILSDIFWPLSRSSYIKEELNCLSC